jgi:hypothetical protein
MINNNIPGPILKKSYVIPLPIYEKLNVVPKTY